jgi:O-antigen/teichoic acid export membrane protein
MKFFKTSILSAVAQVIAVIAGLISSKVVAIYLGANGVGMAGNFYNTTAILQLIATAAIPTGVVKYLAEFKGDKNIERKYITTALQLVLIGSLLVGVIAFLFSGILSQQAFNNNEYQTIYIFWGLLIVFTALNLVISAILNGLQNILHYTIVNICSALLTLAATIVGAMQFGVKGALLAGSIANVVLLAVNYFLLKKNTSFQFIWLKDKLDWSIIKKYSQFMAMALFTGILVPLIQILVRNKIVDQYQFAGAGQWQAVMRISDYYLLFVTTVLGVYYLPKLSSLQESKAIKAEIWKGYKMILPAVAIMSTIIWLCRYLIIEIIFTKEFLPSAEFYAWQFLGDFFKIGAWLLAYLMIAKAMKYTYIITEVLFALSYVLLCFWLLNKFGIIGAVYGFCLNYFLYWVLMFVIMKRKAII